MPEKSSHQLLLKSAKRLAHHLAKEKNISKGEALELLSQKNNFSSWQAYRQHLLKNGSARIEKIDLDEFDPSIHDRYQIRGLFKQTDGSRFQIRTSYASLIGQEFEDIGQLRTYFEKFIRRILSTSKDHIFIFLLIHMDARVKYPFLDEDAFFNSLFDRYERLTNIETRYLDSYPVLEDIQSWIQEKEDFFDFHLKETERDGGFIESYLAFESKGETK